MRCSVWREQPITTVYEHPPEAYLFPYRRVPIRIRQASPCVCPEGIEFPRVCRVPRRYVSASPANGPHNRHLPGDRSPKRWCVDILVEAGVFLCAAVYEPDAYGSSRPLTMTWGEKATARPPSGCRFGSVRLCRPACASAGLAVRVPGSLELVVQQLAHGQYAE